MDQAPDTPGNLEAPPEIGRRSTDDALILTFDEVREGWEQYLLFTSDRHWDAKGSNRAMQKRHLDEARRRGARVFDLGDLFDAMQGRNDRRGSKSSIREEFLTDGYFSRLTERAVEWFGPYADLFEMITPGNHETAVLKHNEVDLTRHLLDGLNDRHGGNIRYGPYSGWIKLQFRTTSDTYRPAIWIYHHHGYGGSAPVTKGSIQTARRAAFLPDANAIVTGHTHQTWLFPIAQERVTERGTVEILPQWHASVPSYKSPSRRKGFEAERGFAPSITGALWCRLYYHGRRVYQDWSWAQ